MKYFNADMSQGECGEWTIANGQLSLVLALCPIGLKLSCVPHKQLVAPMQNVLHQAPQLLRPALPLVSPRLFMRP